MSNRSKKVPPPAFHPNHVLIPPVSHPASLQRRQLASEAAGFGISGLLANRLDERKPAAVLNYLQEGIDCRTFYQKKDRNPKVLFGFLVGLRPKEDLGLKMTFSLDKPPFSNKKREYKPTSKIMQQEVIRRASLQGVSRMPRPAQWSTEKLHEALSVKYLPKMTYADRMFLQTVCQEIYDQAMKRSKEEQTLNDSRVEKSIRWTKDGGWKNPKAVLRLYHMLVDMREIFVTRKESAAAAKAFWETAAIRYNDQAWIPSTAIIPKLEGFKQSTPLPLLAKNVTGPELAIIFGGIKSKLRELVDEWNSSFLPTEMLKENGIVEQWDYAALANRLESREDVEGHVMYLWEFANNNQILGSCMLPIEGEPETNKEAEDLNEKTDKDDVKKEAIEPTEQEIEDLRDEEQGVVDDEHDNRSEESEEEIEAEPSELSREFTDENSVVEGNAIKEPTEQERLDIQHFTTSQELNFEYLRVYNSVENEYFELKVKVTLAKTNEEKKLYKKFAWRKNKILTAMKRHLDRSTNYVARLSKSLGAPPVDVAALPDPELDDDFSYDTGVLLSVGGQRKLTAKRHLKKITADSTPPTDEMETEPSDEESYSSSSNGAARTATRKRAKKKTIKEIIDQAEESDKGLPKKSRKAGGKGKTAQKAETAEETKGDPVKAAKTCLSKEEVEGAKDESDKDTDEMNETQKSASAKAASASEDPADKEIKNQTAKKSQIDSPSKKKESTATSPRTKRAIAVAKQEDTPRRASRRSKSVEEATTRRSSSRRISTPQSDESAKKKRRSR